MSRANPYIHRAATVSDNARQGFATLALAYEHQTRNLLKFLQETDGGLAADARTLLIEEIASRLGVSIYATYSPQENPDA